MPRSIERPLPAATAAVTCLVSSLALGGPAAAADAPGAGPELALRSGYAIPVGGVAGSASADRAMNGMIPIGIDGGYRWRSGLFVGAAVQYGLAQAKDSNAACGFGCSASVIDLGVEGIYRFGPRGRALPWLGMVTGYEWAGVRSSNTDFGARVSSQGFEIARAEAGVDFRLSRTLVAGPFLSASYVRYASTTATNTVSLGSVTYTGTPGHEWVGIGVRGAVDLTF
jgi:hypothetical protein